MYRGLSPLKLVAILSITCGSIPLLIQSRNVLRQQRVVVPRSESQHETQEADIPSIPGQYDDLTASNLRKAAAAKPRRPGANSQNERLKQNDLTHYNTFRTSGDHEGTGFHWNDYRLCSEPEDSAPKTQRNMFLCNLPANREDLQSVTVVDVLDITLSDFSLRGRLRDHPITAKPTIYSQSPAGIFDEASEQYIFVYRAYNKWERSLLLLETFEKKLRHRKSCGVLHTWEPDKITSKWGLGAEDPRLFRYNQSFWIVYNILHEDGTRRVHLRGLNTPEHVDVMLTVEDFPLHFNEKNWTPLVHDGKLYFVYQLYPHVLLGLADDNNPYHSLKQGRLKIVAHSRSWHKGMMHSKLRGGTPFFHVAKGYYAAFAHYVMVDYHPRLVLIRGPHFHDKPGFPVFISKPMRMGWTFSRLKDWVFVLFPTSVVRIRREEDTLQLGLHVQDETMYVVTLRGVLSFLRAKIEEDLLRVNA